MVPILLGAAMFVLAYLTHIEKFNLFTTYMEAKKDEAYLKEMEQKRKKRATILLIVMGAIAVISGIFHLIGMVFYEYLFIAVYLFFIIYLLGSSFGGQGTKSVYIILAAAIAFLYFSTSFRYLFEPNTVNLEVTPGTVMVTGSNEVGIPLSDISSAELLDALPERDHKVGTTKEFNGTFRGTYVLTDGSEAQLYLNGGLKCLKLTTGNDVFYIALVTDEETEAAYNAISEALN